MVRYPVAFRVDGATKTISVGEAQFKKGRLRCQDERDSDSVTVALIPDDNVEYVLEERTELSDPRTEAADDSGGDGGE